LVFLLFLVQGFSFSELFRKLHLPYVIALILAGIIVGPFGFDIIEPDAVVVFLSSVGVLFLMFIAGSEITSKTLKETSKSIAFLALLNSVVPFFVGMGIALFFGFNIPTALILGVTFMSSSVAVIIPSLQSQGLVNTKLGRSIITSTVFEDFGSLLLVGFILQAFKPQSAIPLFAYIPVVLLFIALLKIIIPRLEESYHADKTGQDLFESKLRFTFVVLLASVLLFEVLGMHAIVAGFVIGLLLSDSIQGKIRDKIRTISYGIFIPVFFFMIGVQTDLSVFVLPQSVTFTVCVVFGLVISKSVSGWVGGVISGFSKRESILIAFSTIPQLSTTLAVAYSALAFDIINVDIVATLVILTIVTTLGSPLLIKLYNDVLREKPEKTQTS